MRHATSGSSIKSQVLDLKTLPIFSPLKISVNRGEPRWQSHLNFLLIKVEKEDLTMQFKQEVVEFASEHSNRSAAQRFNVEPKRVREWKDNFDKIKTAKSSRRKVAENALMRILRKIWSSGSTSSEAKCCKISQNDGV